MTNRTIPDQADCLAMIDTLNTEADKLCAALKTAGKTAPEKPAATADCLETCDKLEAHVAQLRTLASAAGLKFGAPTVTAPKTSDAGKTKLSLDEEVASRAAAAKRRLQASAAEQPNEPERQAQGPVTLDAQCDGHRKAKAEKASQRAAEADALLAEVNAGKLTFAEACKLFKASH